VLVWFAREFPIKPSQIIGALGFDVGQSQGERYVDRAVKQVQADLKAKNPLFKTPHLTWDRYAALPAERRREKRLAWLHAAYPTPAVLLEKIRQMPTVKLRHQRREAKEAYLGRDLD